MENEVRKEVILSLQTSNSYQKIYSNDVYVIKSPRKEIVIDFMHTAVDPKTVMGDLDELNTQTETGPEKLAVYVVRERQVTITLEPTEAYTMAKMIIEKMEEDSTYKEIIEDIKEQERESEAAEEVEIK